MSSYANQLEQKLDKLIDLYQQLKRENIALRERESELLSERGNLVEQNELARQKVEVMINRLRNLNADQ